MPLTADIIAEIDKALSRLSTTTRRGAELVRELISYLIIGCRLGGRQAAGSGASRNRPMTSAITISR